MKRVALPMISLLLIIATLAGCTPTGDTVTTGAPTLPATTEAPETDAPGFTVTFDADNGQEAVNVNTQADGTLVFPSYPSREGYSFKGWYTEKNGAGERVKVGTKLSAGTIYYAKWDEYINMEGRNEIIIGGFNGITEAEACEEDFKLLAECGIDVIFMTYFHTDKSYKSDECVKWMEKYGVRCWYNDWELNNLMKQGTTVDVVLEMTAPYRNSSSFYGNYMADEPGPGEFPAFKVALETYKQALPGYELYVNLLPNYAPPAVFPGGKFENYISSFIENVDVSYVCQDVYPITISSNAKKTKSVIAKYYDGLNVVATQARDANRENWMYIYTMRDTVNASKDYLPSITDTRWEAFNAMAFGACGITYYCFATPPSYSKSESFGFTKNHEKTDLWYTGKQLTEEIKALKDIYPKYLWKNISCFSTGDKLGKQMMKLDTIASYKGYLDEVKTTQTLLIGLFDEANGPGRAVMVVNQSDLNEPKAETVSVKIDDAAKVTAYIGTAVNVLERNAEGYYTFTIEAGQGAFITVDLY